MTRLRLNKHILRSDQNRTSPEDDFPEVIEFREKPDADYCREDK
jgi:hypothetical protein